MLQYTTKRPFFINLCSKSDKSLVLDISAGDRKIPGLVCAVCNGPGQNTVPVFRPDSCVYAKMHCVTDQLF